MTSAVCATHHRIVASSAGVVYLGAVGCIMDFLRKTLVNIYGDATRNSELPGSVKKMSSKSHATEAGMMLRMYGKIGSRNLYQQSSFGALWKKSNMRAPESWAVAAVLKDSRFRS
jgi:hypothetical protein